MKVDVRDVLERANLHNLALLDTSLRRVGKELHGPCPFCTCSSTARRHQCDRFRLDAERKHWYCRHCAANGGNAIDYVMRRYQVAFKQACYIALGGQRPTLSPHVKQRTSTAPAMPSKAWQQRGLQLLQDATAALWADAGARARAYLEQRGLRVETLEAWQIGYLAADQRLPADEWGVSNREPLWVPRGLLVPWFTTAGVLSGLKIRRPLPPTARGKYVSVPGSTYRLYGTQTLVVDEPLILVEGEFDAMAVWQQLGHCAASIALGTARLPDAGELRVLCYARPVLVALDADETGDRVAEEIVRLSGNLRRARPVGAKDLAECVADRVNLAAWFQAALEEEAEP